VARWGQKKGRPELIGFFFIPLASGAFFVWAPAGWLASWLAGWLAGWLVGKHAARSQRHGLPVGCQWAPVRAST